jgi:hypothetical protein
VIEVIKIYELTHNAFLMTLWVFPYLASGESAQSRHPITGIRQPSPITTTPG